MEQQSGIVSDAQRVPEKESTSFSASNGVEAAAELLINGWGLRPSENRLIKGKEEIRLEPKTMDLLLRLTAAGGDALSRADLIAQLWPNLYASDDSLNQIVSRLRRSLAQDEVLAKAVITVPKRGYRLNKSVIGANRNRQSVDHSLAAPRKALFNSIMRPLLFVGTALVVSIAAFATTKPSATDSFDYTALKSSVLTKLVGHGAGVQISPDGARVAFAWGRDSAQDSDIYVQRVGDHRPAAVTDHPSAESSPAWSPDGRELLFVRSSVTGACEIVRLNLEQSIEQILHSCRAAQAVDLAWAPGGDKVFYTDRISAAGPFAVHRLDLAANEHSQISFPAATQIGDTGVQISPDGRELAFIRNDTYLDSNIYIADVDGANLRAATQNQKNIRSLTWQADGAHILFATDRASAFGLWRIGKKDNKIVPIPTVLGDVTSVSTSRQGERIVYETARINSKVQKLSLAHMDFDLGPEFEGVSSHDRFPDLSPDGARHVRISERSGQPSLIITDNDTGAEHMLDLDMDLIVSASWSPDGSQLLVGGFAQRNFDVYLVTPATEMVQRLTDHRASDYNPTWSADGKRTYFTSNRTGRFEIWCLNIATGGERQISFNGGHRAIEAEGKRLFLAKKHSDGLFELDLNAPNAPEKQITAKLSSLDWRNWDQTGEHIYYVAREHEARAALRRVNINNGEDVVVRELGDFPLMSGLTVTPDETAILVTKVMSAETDLMMLDGFSGERQVKRTLQASR